MHVLSSPRIATINNQKAVLKVGTDEFFVTGVQHDTTSSAQPATPPRRRHVQPFFSGVVLDVTPQIDDKGNIILHVHPSVSQVAEKQKNVNLGTAGSLKPAAGASTVNESDSIVRGPGRPRGRDRRPDAQSSTATTTRTCRARPARRCWARCSASEARSSRSASWWC